MLHIPPGFDCLMDIGTSWSYTFEQAVGPAHLRLGVGCVCLHCECRSDTRASMCSWTRCDCVKSHGLGASSFYISTGGLPCVFDIKHSPCFSIDQHMLAFYVTKNLGKSADVKEVNDYHKRRVKTVSRPSAGLYFTHWLSVWNPGVCSCQGPVCPEVLLLFNRGSSRLALLAFPL